MSDHSTNPDHARKRFEPVEDLASAVAYAGKSSHSPKARLVFIQMAQYPSRPYCYGSLDELRPRTGYGNTAIGEAQKELVEAGVLVREFKNGQRPTWLLRVPSTLPDSEGVEGVEEIATLPDSEPTLPDSEPTLPDSEPTLPDSGTEVCSRSSLKVSERRLVGEPTDREGRKEPKRALPESWRAPPDWRDYARTLGLDIGTIKAEEQRFWKYNKGKGSTNTAEGWFAWWKRWLAREYDAA